MSSAYLELNDVNDHTADGHVYLFPFSRDQSEEIWRSIYDASKLEHTSMKELYGLQHGREKFAKYASSLRSTATTLNDRMVFLLYNIIDGSGHFHLTYGLKWLPKRFREWLATHIENNLTEDLVYEIKHESFHAATFSVPDISDLVNGKRIQKEELDHYAMEIVEDFLRKS